MEKSREAFRTNSEVAEWLNTQTHVLRYWESRFSQVKPIKRAGGRRYYRPADMALLGGSKKLLHDEGITIKGVQKILREHGVKYVSSLSPAVDGSGPSEIIPSEEILTLTPKPVPRSKKSMGFRDALRETEVKAHLSAEDVEPLVARLKALQKRMEDGSEPE